MEAQAPRFPWLWVLPVIVLVLLEILLDPMGRFPGRPWIDGYGTQWHFWMFGEWLAGRADLEPCTLLFHPWGKPMLAHTGLNLLDAALAWPLRLAADPALGSSLWLAAVLLGNAAGGFVLARVLGAGRRAWFGALVLLLCPFCLEELQLGRPTQAMLIFPALFLADLWRLDSRGRAVRAGLWLALTGLGYWYYGLLCGGLLLLHAVVTLILGPDRRSPLVRYGILSGVAALLVAPVAVPLVLALAGGEVPGLLAVGDAPVGGLALRTVEGEAEGLYVLAMLSGRAGSLIDEGGLRFVPGAMVAGPLLWGLVLAGLVAAKDRGRAVLLGWLVFCLAVAVGPVLVLGDRFVGNPIYAGVVATSEVMQRWWWPGRAVALAWVLAAGMGALALSRLPGRRLPALLGVGFALALGLQGVSQELLPLASWRVESSPGLACLAAAPPGAVIDLPDNTGQRNLYLQTLHGKPILGGMPSTKAAFVPVETQVLRSTNSWLETLISVGGRRFPRTTGWEEQDAQAIRALGFEYVLVQKDMYQRHSAVMGEETSDWPRVQRHLQLLIDQPAYEDESVAIYVLGGGELACEAGE
jgi:hypothetical protein